MCEECGVEGQEGHFEDPEGVLVEDVDGELKTQGGGCEEVDIDQELSGGCAADDGLTMEEDTDQDTCSGTKNHAEGVEETARETRGSSV